MQPSDSCAALLAEIERVLAAREASIPAPLADAVRAVRLALAAAPTPRGAPCGAPLPVLRWIERLGADGDGTLLAAFARCAPQLKWRQSYRIGEVEAGFLANYGWTELLGPRAERAVPGAACGLLLLGAHTLYPPHRHEAEEIYVPLSGAADWRRGSGPWTRRRPGEVIHHRSEEPHAMRTDADPLLALYVWRSEDPAQSARIVAGAA